MRIGPLSVGEGRPAALIAELSNNHNGSYDRAIRLLDAAKDCGADAAKLQCFTPAELIALRGDGPAPAPWNGMSMGELYAKAMTPREWFPKLYAHAESIGLPIFSSVFGQESLEFLESIGNPCYKIAALDYESYGVRAAVDRTGKPVITSCSSTFAPFDCLFPIYCPAGYPQPEANLRNIRHSYHGYSYHGTDYRVPALSVAAGAKVVEVHFHLHDEPSELEAEISLDEWGFRDMVNDVREIERVL